MNPQPSTALCKSDLSWSFSTVTGDTLPTLTGLTGLYAKGPDY